MPIHLPSNQSVGEGGTKEEKAWNEIGLAPRREKRQEKNRFYQRRPEITMPSTHLSVSGGKNLDVNVRKAIDCIELSKEVSY